MSRPVRSRKRDARYVGREIAGDFHPVASRTSSARRLAHSKTGEPPRRFQLRAASWSAAVFLVLCRFGIGSLVFHPAGDANQEQQRARP
jgi:hypothetical protein